MQKEIIKIMPDYNCFPIWRMGPNIIENVNPNELPISANLKKRLFNWGEKYDNTLNNFDPVISGFKSAVEEKIFIEEGKIIWKIMLAELGEKYEIEYFNVKNGNLYYNIDDLKT